MREHRTVHLASGIVAGIAGGLIASWVMNEFMANLGPSIQKAVQGDDQQEPVGPKPDDATMKTADAVVSTVTGGRHLSHEGKEKGGPIVHYAFGAIMGATYGAIAEEIPQATFGFGTAFGAALFAGADLVAVPALNLSGSPGDVPVSSLTTPFAAHLVYGAVTEAIRRGLRAVL